MTKSKGIKILTARSKPRLTPLDTIQITEPINRVCQNNNCRGELIKFVKIASELIEFAVAKLLVKTK